MESTALLEDNMDFFEKKKKKSSDFMKQGIKNIAGVSLISSTADIIESF